MQPFAELVVTGTPVDVQTVLLVLAMMAECIGIKIASAARGMATSCIGGIADKKAALNCNRRHAADGNASGRHCLYLRIKLGDLQVSEVGSQP
jgi:hypothetical protein